MRHHAFPFLVLFFAVAGCGSDAAGPQVETFASIAGTYNGSLAGVSQGVGLQGVFTLTMQQGGGTISGTYGMVGRLTEGAIFADVQGSGLISGTIASGNNPSVNIALRVGSCANYAAPFTGTYDNANSRMTLTGNVDILNSDCTVFLRYPSVVILTR